MACVYAVAALVEGAVKLKIFGGGDDLPAPLLWVALTLIAISLAMGLVQWLAEGLEAESVGEHGFGFAGLPRPDIDSGREHFPVPCRPGGGI